jgi:hypothetical protein
MSSSHAAGDIPALKNKIAQLGNKQRIQRMAQKVELIKREASEEKNKRYMLHALENEKRDRLLENERRDRKDLEQKMDHMKMEAALHLQNEKRDRLLENEKRDRELERKDLEQKMGHMKMEAALHVQNEKRDRLLENEKQDRLLENEKRDHELERKDLEQKMDHMKMENEKRDWLLENERRDRLLEDERRVRQAEKKEMEMMVALEKNEREHQHQIEQLKSEVCISQMEQQLLEMRAYTSQGIPISRPTIQHTATVDAAPQRDTELLLLQRIQQMEKERQLKPKATVPAVQPTTLPNEGITSPLQAPDTSHKTALQPVPQKAAAVSQPSKVLSQQPHEIPPHKPDTTTTALQPLLQPAPHTSAVAPATTTSANARIIPLPGDSHTHFFLSHCQSTGGDQVNAIYLELQKLGFICWYDNRATDLTKEGMSKGIVHAAAFLLFLSKGVLERPFCELFLRCWLFISIPLNSRLSCTPFV